jgi:hypothetical protein
LFKSLETFQETLAAQNYKQPVLIVLNNIDKLLHTQHDLNLLVALLTKLYVSPSSAHYGLKLVLTLSSTPSITAAAKSATPTPTKTSKLVAQLFKKLEQLFPATHAKVLQRLNINETNSSDTSLFSQKLKQLQHLREKLAAVLFANAHMSPDSASLLDLLLYLLKETRYGLKQTEIVDILHNFAAASTPASSSAGLTKKLLNHLIPIVWYTFKYHLVLFNKTAGLTEFIRDDNRLLFKLGIFGQSFAVSGGSGGGGGGGSTDKFNEAASAYFALAPVTNRHSITSGLKTVVADAKRTALFASRAYRELAKFAFMKRPSDAAAYLNEFVLNAKWLVGKTEACGGSVLYYVGGDVSFFRSVFVAAENAAAAADEVTSDAAVVDKFKRFERFVYQYLYNLSQDVNGLEMLLKLDGKAHDFDSALARGGKEEATFSLQPLNHAQVMEELSAVENLNFALKKGIGFLLINDY